MFDVTFLGTSASAPSIQRGLSAQVVLANEHRFLVDCGEGTQRQILKSGLGFRRINKILLTHGHLDHILGLGGLISTFTRWETMEEITIWAGAFTLERIHDLIFKVVLRGARPSDVIHLEEVKPGLVFQDKGFCVRAFPVQHRGPDCYGYLFEEDSRRPFLADKAEALGIPHGPERRDLVQGKAVTLADGRVIGPDEVLGDLIPGARLAFTGDYGRVDARLTDAVRDVDVLVSEATYLAEDEEMAREHGHVTAGIAAALARDAGIGGLLLTHLSRRYRESDILHEAQAIFPGAIVARDFDTFRVRQGRPPEKVEE